MIVNFKARVEERLFVCLFLCTNESDTANITFSICTFTVQFFERFGETCFELITGSHARATDVHPS